MIQDDITHHTTLLHSIGRGQTTQRTAARHHTRRHCSTSHVRYCVAQRCYVVVFLSCPVLSHAAQPCGVVSRLRPLSHAVWCCGACVSSRAVSCLMPLSGSSRCSRLCLAWCVMSCCLIRYAVWYVVCARAWRIVLPRLVLWHLFLSHTMCGAMCHGSYGVVVSAHLISRHRCGVVLYHFVSCHFIPSVVLLSHLISSHRLVSDPLMR